MTRIPALIDELRPGEPEPEPVGATQMDLFG
jgi:hypothetical protein